MNQLLSREEVATWLKDLADLHPNLEFLGFIFFDEAIFQVANRQHPLWSLATRGPAGKSFTRNARRLPASPRRRGGEATSSPLGGVGSAIDTSKDTGKGYHG